MRDFWRAIKFATISKKLTFYAIGSALVVTAFGIAIPLVFKAIFDLIGKTIQSGSIGTVTPAFWVLMAIYGAIVVTSDAMGQVNFYATTLWYNKTREILSKNVYEHLENLSLSYFESNSTGKIKERVDKGVWDLVDIMSDIFMDILPQIIYVLAAAGILFSINIAFGTILLLSIPLFVLISIRFSPQLIKIQDEFRDSNEKLSGITTESIIILKPSSHMPPKRDILRNFQNSF